VAVTSWFDDMSDSELRDMIPYLEKLSTERDVYAMLNQRNCQVH